MSYSFVTARIGERWRAYQPNRGRRRTTQTMRLSITFSAYVGRQFLFWFFSVSLILITIILLFDIVELIRRTSGREEATLGVAFIMALLKTPSMIEKAVPFSMLFGSMFAFWRLNRSQELVVARASGVSVWQILLPVILLATLIGGFKITVFNPLSSAMLLRYEQLEAKYIRGKSSLAAVSDDGLWLRHATETGHYILHARRVLPREMRLKEVIVLMMEAGDKFVGRIDAADARLRRGYWALTDARLTPSDGTPRSIPYHEIDTNLTPENIQDSFAPPETLSFWALPRFISVLEKAGFSGLRHRLYWHTQLAVPVLLCAMVLLAATFSLRPARRGGAGIAVVCGVATGFLLYFLSDVVSALGVSARVPVVLAAWSPAAVSCLLGTAMLFHLEDG